MNIENLKKLREQVYKHGPEGLNMSRWYGYGTADFEILDVASEREIGCGTTACLAGHAAAIMIREGAVDTSSRRHHDRCCNDVEIIADWLGIDREDYYESDDYDPRNMPFLFHVDLWCMISGCDGKEHSERYIEGSPEERWKATIDLLDQLIEKESK